MSTPEDTPDAADDLRRKYQEALERKRGRAAVREGHEDAGSHLSPKSESAKTQRMFRRKSG